MDIKPFRIKYYLERKDPDFENKMHDVLLVYKQVEMQFGEDGTVTIPECGYLTHTVSYDEKPGIQAIANKYPDHNPTKENGYVCRDCEYVRLETLSLLAESICCQVKQSRWSARHTKVVILSNF